MQNKTLNYTFGWNISVILRKVYRKVITLRPTFCILNQIVVLIPNKTKMSWREIRKVSIFQFSCLTLIDSHQLSLSWSCMVQILVSFFHESSQLSSILFQLFFPLIGAWELRKLSCILGYHFSTLTTNFHPPTEDWNCWSSFPTERFHFDLCLPLPVIHSPWLNDCLSGIPTLVCSTAISAVVSIPQPVERTEISRNSSIFVHISGFVIFPRNMVLQSVSLKHLAC